MNTGDAILAAYLDFLQIMPNQGRPANALSPNESSRILRFEDMIIAGKLMAMGILPNAQIQMVRRNALGHTLIFRINNRFKIALRRDEAQTIIVEGA
jgi:Fe2+ transport system protein FeoA